MFSKEKLIAYIQLMRLDRPIGTLLLLWPTLWALFLSVKGIPPFSILTIFILGVIFMRAAGCVINDYANRNIDGWIYMLDRYRDSLIFLLIIYGSIAYFGKTFYKIRIYT